MIKYWVIVFAMLVLTSCKSTEESLRKPAGKEKDSITVYIGKHGWHTAFIIEKADLAPLFPELTVKFPEAHYLDISWGDKKYFMAPKGTFCLAVRAALLPTKSVVRVLGFTKNLETYFSQSNIQAVQLSAQGFYQLVNFIKRTFAREKSNKLVSLDEQNVFYLSGKTYWGIRTCNVWTARALKRGGFPITPIFSIRADYVLRKVSSVGEN